MREARSATAERAAECFCISCMQPCAWEGERRGARGRWVRAAEESKEKAKMLPARIPPASEWDQRFSPQGARCRWPEHQITRAQLRVTWRRREMDTWSISSARVGQDRRTQSDERGTGILWQLRVHWAGSGSQSSGWYAHTHRRLLRSPSGEARGGSTGLQEVLSTGKKCHRSLVRPRGWAPGRTSSTPASSITLDAAGDSQKGLRASAAAARSSTAMRGSLSEKSAVCTAPELKATA